MREKIMFSNFWHQTFRAVTWVAATLLAQSANASPPLCTLSATPAIVSSGASSTLTANCSPAATSFEWSGGTCAGTTSSNCTVTPTVTTTYSLIGSNAGGTSTAVSANVFAGGRYD